MSMPSRKPPVQGVEPSSLEFIDNRVCHKIYLAITL